MPPKRKVLSETAGSTSRSMSVGVKSVGNRTTAKRRTGVLQGEPPQKRQRIRHTEIADRDL